MPVFFTTSVSWGKQQLSVYILNANFLANFGKFGNFWGKFWHIFWQILANFRVAICKFPRGQNFAAQHRTKYTRTPDITTRVYTHQIEHKTTLTVHNHFKTGVPIRPTLIAHRPVSLKQMCRLIAIDVHQHIVYMYVHKKYTQYRPRPCFII